MDSAYMNQKKSKFKSKIIRIYSPAFRRFYPEKHKILIFIYKLTFLARWMNSIKNHNNNNIDNNYDTENCGANIWPWIFYLWCREM